MPDVEVVIPFREEPRSGHRGRALALVTAAYRARHPDWTLTVATLRAGAWIKAAAVMPAVHASRADILVVADADVWSDDVGDAVAAVAGGSPWAIPHLNVFRLNQEATARLDHDDLSGGAPPDCDLEERAYRGVEGGGIVVLPRDLAREVPLDRRFRGWGSEDLAWGIALRRLAGRPSRGTGALLHLWHPPQPRATRAVGSYASWRLLQRYHHAALSPRSRMRELLAET